MTEPQVINEPEEVEINLSDAVAELPSTEFEKTYLPIEDGMVIEGIYDGIVKVDISEFPNRNPEDTRTHANVLRIIREGLTEGSTEYQKFWCSNGLLRKLSLYEVEKGNKIYIKRVGAKLDTDWILKV